MYLFDYDQMIHYVFSSHLYLYTYSIRFYLICGHAFLSLSMGMPASDGVSF